MEQIYSYIADRLLETETRLWGNITALQKLSIAEHPAGTLRAGGGSEPERTQGLLRQMLVDNYSVFYIVGGRMPCRWPVCCTVHPTLYAVCGE